MANVKWIKITTDMFDNQKIKYIRKLPEGNNIILIWVMLLTMAGRCNSGGMIFLTENIPYSTKMLADELGFDENIIIIAINALEKLSMVTTDNDMLFIPGWEEHQNVDGMERIREQSKKRVQKYREKKKLLSSDTCNVTSNDNSNVSCNVTVTEGYAIEEDKEKEEDIYTVSKDTVRKTDVRLVMEKWNTLSEYGIKPVTKISCNARRYKNLVARMKEYSVDEILEAIENIKHSRFLQGKSGGSRQWRITFDWFVLPSNFPKVLECQYEDKEPGKVEFDEDFMKIYEIFPKQEGKTKGYEYYSQWLNGKMLNGRIVSLTKRQMYLGVKRYAQYCEKEQLEQRFIKNFDTFMAEAIVDYIQEGD